MKHKNFWIVYKTVNLVTGEYYFGSHGTNNLDDGYMGSGNRIRVILRNKGKENLRRTILFIFEEKFDALKKERELTRIHLSDILCSNLPVGSCKGEPLYKINSVSRAPVPFLQVINLLEFSDLSSHRIGEKLGVTGSRIRQIASLVGIDISCRGRGRPRKEVISKREIIRKRFLSSISFSDCK